MIDYEAKKTTIRKQLRDLERQEIRSKAQARRADMAKRLSPEQQKAHAELDALTHRVFAQSPDGLTLLSAMSETRPVVADEINERIYRAEKSDPVARELRAKADNDLNPPPPEPEEITIVSGDETVADPEPTAKESTVTDEPATIIDNAEPAATE